MTELLAPKNPEETFAFLKESFPLEDGIEANSLEEYGFQMFGNKSLYPASAEEQRKGVFEGAQIWVREYKKLNRSENEAKQAFAITLFAQNRLRKLRAAITDPNVEESAKAQGYEKSKDLSVSLANYYLEGDADGTLFLNLIDKVKEIDSFTLAEAFSLHGDIASVHGVLAEMTSGLLDAENVRDVVTNKYIKFAGIQRKDKTIDEQVVSVFEDQAVDILGIPSTGTIAAAMLSKRLEDLTGRKYPLKQIFSGKDTHVFYAPEITDETKAVWLIDEQSGYTYKRNYDYLVQKPSLTVIGKTTLF